MQAALREEGFKGEAKGQLLGVESGPGVRVHGLGEGGHARHRRGGQRRGALLHNTGERGQREVKGQVKVKGQKGPVKHILWQKQRRESAVYR